MPIVNEQISAIYDNCKSRQRASGILCKCQRRATNDKQIERARLSATNKFVASRKSKDISAEKKQIPVANKSVKKTRT